jgi:hypothetical protein
MRQPRRGEILGGESFERVSVIWELLRYSTRASWLACPTNGSHVVRLSVYFNFVRLGGYQYTIPHAALEIQISTRLSRLSPQTLFLVHNRVNTFILLDCAPRRNCNRISLQFGDRPDPWRVTTGPRSFLIFLRGVSRFSQFISK